MDGGGPTGDGPVDPWGPYVKEFAADLMLAEAAKKVSPDLKSSVMALAAKQVSLAGAAIQKGITAVAKGTTRKRVRLRDHRAGGGNFREAQVAG